MVPRRLLPKRPAAYSDSNPEKPKETFMAKMTAVQAAVLVMEKEGVTQAFGVPGAAINPLYSAMRQRGSIAHILARHVEGASHMAER